MCDRERSLADRERERMGSMMKRETERETERQTETETERGECTTHTNERKVMKRGK